MIGINNNKDFINKNLLSVNLNIFNYIFKINLLFPPILKNNLQKLSNTLSNSILLPVNCAVDDLELYNDQIYDLLNNPTFYEPNNHHHHHQNNNIHSQQHKIQQPKNNQKQHGNNLNNTHVNNHNNTNNVNLNSNLNSILTDEIINPGFSGMMVNNMVHSNLSIHNHNNIGINQPVINHHHQTNNNINNINGSTSSGINIEYPSHYNLMVNNQHNYYFNDFNHDLIDLDVYSSSNESFISPLDDEFYKLKPKDEISNSYNTTVTGTGTGNGSGNGFQQLDYYLSDSPKDSISSVNSYKKDFEKDFEKNFSNFKIKQEFNNFTIKNEFENDHDLDVEPEHEQEDQEDVEIKDEVQREVEREIKEEKSKKRKLPDSNIEKKRPTKDDDLKFECSFCNAKFKVKGYLTRHLKKHQSFKAFKCPFYHENPSNGKGTKCHPTGGFSRRDTYKTHLKALHFIYPPGTKSNERNLISGRCAGCFSHFNNNIDWLENHIEKGCCNGTLN